MVHRILHFLHQTTNAIMRGDLSQRIPLTENEDKSDEVAAAINAMLDGISQQMDGLLQTSNAIAHDLRAPIARARAELEDAVVHAHTEVALRTTIDHAIAHLDHVTSICDALLRIAQIETGSRHSAFTWFDLIPALQDVLELYAAVAEDREITIKTNFPEKLPFYGDRAMLQQAMANVLDNAIKFSPAKSLITCSAQLLSPKRHSKNGGTIRLSIADRGLGMTPEDMAHATKRFFRAEQSRHIAGSGLGLSVVQAIVQLHDGQLHLADNNPGLIVHIDMPLPRTESDEITEINR